MLNLTKETTTDVNVNSFRANMFNKFHLSGHVDSVEWSTPNCERAIFNLKLKNHYIILLEFTSTTYYIGSDLI